MAEDDVLQRRRKVDDRIDEVNDAVAGSPIFLERFCASSALLICAKEQILTLLFEAGAELAED